jgi:predicted ArsR family transcriptional regulator
MIQDKPLRKEAVERAMSSSASRQILASCVERPLAVKEIGQATGVPIASVYRQVADLEKEGLLVVERSALTPDGKAYDLFRSRVRRASVQVGPEGVDVVWEVNRAVEERLAVMWNRLGG